VIYLDLSKGTIGFLRKHNGQFGKWTMASNGNINKALWIFAITRTQLPHVNLRVLCIWKNDFLPTCLCIMLPNTQFEIQLEKVHFGSLKGN